MGLEQTGGIIEHLGAIGLLKGPEARVFVVDPSDTGFTIQDAIDECVAGNGDIIVKIPGGVEVTEAVNFNKSGITLIASHRGLNPLVQGEFSAIYAAAGYTDGPVGIISAPCTIIGMGFASRDTGALFFAGAALLVGGAAAGAFGVHLKQCRFPKWGFGNRIGLALAGGAAISDMLIEECTFEGVGSDFQAGIYMQGALQNITIRRNYFHQCTAAVKLGAIADAVGPHMFLHENFIEDGLTLDSQGNTADGLVAGNWGELAAGSSYDDSVNALIGQGINFSGNHYAET